MAAVAIVNVLKYISVAVWYGVQCPHLILMQLRYVVVVVGGGVIIIIVTVMVLRR